MKIVIVVAAARNGVIGRDGGMPWRLPTDLKHFKALTLGKPVVMGRRTWETLGRPLPGRANIVISRNRDFKPDGVEVTSSLDAALELAAVRARALGVDEICVIGGGQIYAAAMARADVIHLTVVEETISGDTVFPAIDPAIFDRLSEQPVHADEKDSHSMVFTLWKRRPS